MRLLRWLWSRWSLRRRVAEVDRRIRLLTNDHARVIKTLRRERKTLERSSRRLHDDLQRIESRCRQILDDSESLERRYKTELDIALSDKIAAESAAEAMMAQNRSLLEMWEAQRDASLIQQAMRSNEE